MPAKNKTTKKTFKRRVTSRRRVKPVESTVQEQAEIIPNNSFQPVQPVQPIQPIVSASPVEPIQPVQPAQPIQQVTSMQAVPMTSSPQPAPNQENSSFENPITQPPQSEDPEPEIKMEAEDKSATGSAIAGKGKDPKADASQTVTEADKNKSDGKKNLVLPIVFIVLLGTAILGGLFIYRENFSKKVEEKVNEVSLTKTSTVEPTPKPIDLSKFTIEILNGSGVEGAASTQKADLEEIGFKVESIGNADESNYTETVVKAKESVDKSFLDKLRTILEESFEVSVEDLDEEAETDIVIIIGSRNE